MFPIGSVKALEQKKKKKRGKEGPNKRKMLGGKGGKGYRKGLSWVVKRR